MSLLLLLAVCGITVMGCGKKEEKEVDPIEYARSLIPLIEKGLNYRDIPRLRDMGTTNFEANRFIADVFGHGVSGNVTLEMIRVRFVTDDLRLFLRAKFDNGAGGVKELEILFTDGGKWKINSYTLHDKSIPPPEPGKNALDSLPAQAAPTDPS